MVCGHHRRIVAAISAEASNKGISIRSALTPLLHCEILADVLRSRLYVVNLAITFIPFEAPDFLSSRPNLVQSQKHLRCE